ncbi:MAG: hypothetical protein HN368_11765 [Spirochaetales bacterium]|jgi:hypothetical protein|nr:hypothetical protein [Spirochaetales bacterium]
MIGKDKVLLGILCLVAVSAWADRAAWIENATDFEETLAIQAFSDVKKYYENFGFSIPEGLPPTIFFQDRLTISGGAPSESMGLFDHDSMSVWIVHFKSPKFQRQGYLGDKSANMYYSIIVHEFAHYMNALVSPGLPHATNELIAGVVQVDLMNPETRRRILSKGGVLKFSSYRDVTLFTYFRGPQNFILASYYYCMEHPKMLLRFLNQTVPEIRDPFLFD